MYSLYGAARKPGDEMVEDLDVLIYDIQDVGVRFYTYISTMGYAMQAAARNGVEFWILDRPDPITGTRVNGPPRKRRFESFVGLYPIPVRYGMTPGELAGMMVGEGWLEFPEEFGPKVIKMQHWERSLWYDETDIPWTAPSPNMPTLATAAAYPGMCLVEGTNVSEGRGTPHPFLWIGAPWIDGKELSRALNRQQLPGVVFEPVTFTPRLIPGKALRPKYRNEQCGGIRVVITDRELFRAVPAGIHLLAAIRQLYPESFRWREGAIDRLYGSGRLRKALDRGKPPKRIVRGWRRSVRKFQRQRQQYLLY